MEDSLKLKSGETILIQGGAGGVATFAIQLAKHLGTRVITTASAANLSYLRDLGADLVIDYNATDFTKAVSNCDAVFDTVGGDVATRSFAVLKPGGRAAFIASGAKAPTPERGDVTALRPIVGRDRPHLDRIAALYKAGVIRKPEVTLYQLSDAVEATRASEAARRAICPSCAVSSPRGSAARAGTVSPVAASSRRVRSVNASAPVAAKIWCAVLSWVRASAGRPPRRSHSP